MQIVVQSQAGEMSYAMKLFGTTPNEDVVSEEMDEMAASFKEIKVFLVFKFQLQSTQTDCNNIINSIYAFEFRLKTPKSKLCIPGFHWMMESLTR